ncbi:TonB family protein [Marispirochaeta sp.]|uniref:energy transducer TonB n=1 Tax=Marispirochaeta sp. TaxID=2038653 RepID=UPI0029C63CCE|nr:TonB family protein [Marispirochaeta sp.]
MKNGPIPAAFVLSILIHSLLVFGYYPDLKVRPAPEEKTVSIQLADVRSPAPPAEEKQDTPAVPSSPLPSQTPTEPEPAPEPDPPAASPATPTSLSKETTVSAPETSDTAPDPATREAWAVLVRQQIHANRKYPLAARRREEEGIVVVSFSLDRKGSIVSGPAIEKPCRSPRLNRAALQAVREGAPYPEHPAGAGPESAFFSVPIHFSLD